MRKKPVSKKNNRLHGVVVVVVFLLITSLYAYQKYQAKRDFELQFAYYYCHLRIKELHEEGKGADMEYYYQIAKGFEQRINDLQGMEDAVKSVEAIYWKYER